MSDYYCWLGVARFPPMPRLSSSEFGWFWSGMTTLEVIQNKKLIESQGKKSFLSCVT